MYSDMLDLIAKMSAACPDPECTTEIRNERMGDGIILEWSYYFQGESRRYGVVISFAALTSPGAADIVDYELRAAEHHMKQVVA